MDPVLIQKALGQYQSATFGYDFPAGQLDCCLFVANVLRDATGQDPAKDLRHQYTSRRGAFRLIKACGSLKDLVTRTLGKPFDHIWHVQPGDLVLIKPPLVEADFIGEGLGIYDGISLKYLTAKGLTEAPVLAGRGCWHV